jgi:hypothetical protein
LGTFTTDADSDVDWHVDRGIVAVACDGRDLIRVWPLPMEQPWFEDKVECPDKLWELLAW